MLSYPYPYPVPRLRTWRAAMLIGWTAGIIAGLWVLAYPPLSYDNIGLALTTIWGAMLAAGSGLTAIGHLTQRYKIELPGLVLALGGVVIYDYLSWQQTLTTSPGSGPRALLLVVLACLLIARIRVLIYMDRQARQRVEMRDSAV